MARKILQPQFNELVKENMELFDMEEQEAVDSAVEQLRAQGVSLANIVPDIAVVRGEDPVSVFLENYSHFLGAYGRHGFDVDEYLQRMQEAIAFACKGPNYQLYAGNAQVDAVILVIAKIGEAVIVPSLKALIKLYHGYPDLMTEETVDWLIELYGRSTADLRMLILTLIDEGCTAHENNKQLLYSKREFMDILRSIIDSNSEELLARALHIVCNLCTDDDMRELTRVHERAVGLAEGRICGLYDMLQSDNPLEVKVCLLNALRSLIRTNQTALELFHHDEEFEIMNTFYMDHIQEKEVLTAAMKFLFALACCDEAKDAMGLLTEHILSSIDLLMAYPPLCQSGFLLISALALRNQGNARMMIGQSAVSIIVQGMKLHPSREQIQRNGCMALRNLAMQGESMGPFRENDVAELARELIAANVSETLTDHAKSVLIALREEVELEERWKGTGRNLPNCPEPAH